MILQYLINYKQELAEKRIDMIQSLHKIELKIKENMEFIRLIENSQDKVYDSFSPHNYNVNNTNNIKMKGLKKESERLQENKNKIKKEMEDIDQKMKDLDSMIQYLKNVERNQVENKKIENQRIEQNKETEEEMQKFHFKLLENFETEKQKIASEIYELNLENVTGIIHKIEACSKFVDLDAKRCKLELQSLIKEMNKISKDLKKLSFQIHPAPVKEVDNISELLFIEKEIERFQRKNEVKIHYTKEGNFKNISEVVMITLFRILKEVCKNVKKHAEAENLYINLVHQSDVIRIEILDDGCGFDVKTLEKNGSGLKMIQNQIRLLSGTILIESKKKKGTKICITLPA